MRPDSHANINGALVTAVTVNHPLHSSAFQMAVMAASPGLYPAVRATLTTGRFTDAGHSDRVALLGRYAAQELGISNLSQQAGIFIGDHVYAVLGGRPPAESAQRG